MLSSTSSTRLPSRTSGSGVYFEPGLGGAVGRALDERPADVAVAHQPFDRGQAQCEGHGVGGGLGRVGHRHDDRVGVERHVLQPGQFLAQRDAAQVDRAVVERAGHVGEVDPLEEAMGLPRRGGEPLDPHARAGWRRPACPARATDVPRSPGSSGGRSRWRRRRAGRPRRCRAAGNPCGSRATTRSPMAVSRTTL